MKSTLFWFSSIFVFIFTCSVYCQCVTYAYDFDEDPVDAPFPFAPINGTFLMFTSTGSDITANTNTFIAGTSEYIDPPDIDSDAGNDITIEISQPTCPVVGRIEFSIVYGSTDIIPSGGSYELFDGDSSLLASSSIIVKRDSQNTIISGANVVVNNPILSGPILDIRSIVIHTNFNGNRVLLDNVMITCCPVNQTINPSTTQQTTETTLNPTQTTVASTESSNSSQSGLTGEESAGLAVGIVLLCCMYAIMFVAAIKFYKSRNYREVDISLDRIGLHSIRNALVTKSRRGGQYSAEEIHLINDVIIQKEIGKGNFGVVRKGKWKNNEVALKSISSHNDTTQDDFIEELSLLVKFSHPNVITCYGVHIDLEGTLYMVTEFMHKGDLLSLLSKENMADDELYKFIDQISSGMAYLHEKDVIHRDLACRNVLISKHGVAKVSDFGMSRIGSDIYVSENTKQFPIRWCAPETIQNRKYSQKTDIYSFGVVMWEVLTRGGHPYANIDKNVDAADLIVKGKHLVLPDKYENTKYGILCYQCFTMDESSRPSFDMISNFLTTYDESHAESGYNTPVSYMNVEGTDPISYMNEPITYNSKSQQFTITTDPSLKSSYF